MRCASCPKLYSKGNLWHHPKLSNFNNWVIQQTYIHQKRVDKDVDIQGSDLKSSHTRLTIIAAIANLAVGKTCTNIHSMAWCVRYRMSQACAKTIFVLSCVFQNHLTLNSAISEPNVWCWILLLFELCHSRTQCMVLNTIVHLTLNSAIPEPNVWCWILLLFQNPMYGVEYYCYSRTQCMVLNTIVIPEPNVWCWILLLFQNPMYGVEYYCYSRTQCMGLNTIVIPEPNVWGWILLFLCTLGDVCYNDIMTWGVLLMWWHHDMRCIVDVMTSWHEVYCWCDDIMTWGVLLMWWHHDMRCIVDVMTSLFDSQMERISSQISVGNSSSCRRGGRVQCSIVSYIRLFAHFSFSWWNLEDMLHAESLLLCCKWTKDSVVEPHWIKNTGIPAQNSWATLIQTPSTEERHAGTPKLPSLHGVVFSPRLFLLVLEECLHKQRKRCQNCTAVSCQVNLVSLPGRSLWTSWWRSSATLCTLSNDCHGWLHSAQQHALDMEANSWRCWTTVSWLLISLSLSLSLSLPPSPSLSLSISLSLSLSVSLSLTHSLSLPHPLPSISHGGVATLLATFAFLFSFFSCQFSMQDCQPVAKSTKTIVLFCSL